LGSNRGVSPAGGEERTDDKEQEYQNSYAISRGEVKWSSFENRRTNTRGAAGIGGDRGKRGESELRYAAGTYENYVEKYQAIGPEDPWGLGLDCVEGVTGTGRGDQERIKVPHQEGGEVGGWARQASSRGGFRKERD